MERGPRRGRFFLFWLLAAVLAAHQEAAARELKDTLKRIKPGVVGVGTFEPLRKARAVFLGTGFAVADGHFVVTNHHVVDRELDFGRKETFAVFLPRRGKEPGMVPAGIRHCDERHDLCLLELEGSRKLPPLQLGHSSDVEEGKAYALTGFPIGMVLGLYPVTHQGIVAAITPIVIPGVSTRDFSARMIRTMRSPFDVFQLDAIAYPGNSGSPLYETDTGRVVGVVNSVFVKGTKEAALEHPSGISYAIPVTHVYELLLRAGLKP